MQIDFNKFKKFLDEQNLSEKTKEVHLFSVKQFYKHFKKYELNKNTILSYRTYLMENFSPKTTNLRLTGVNSYLKSIGQFEKLHVDALKIQQKSFLENVISEADYDFLKEALKKDDDMNGYFLVRFLGATGARVSEFCKFKVEHVKKGYFDIYGKGVKFRRIYIPKSLQEEALQHFRQINKNSGYIFTTLRGNEPYSPRTVSAKLKAYAEKYGIDKNVVYPHSFRHRYAKSFIERYKDISFLADLLGHESIDTTRIYVRKTATEQKEIVDNIVTW